MSDTADQSAALLSDGAVAPDKAGFRFDPGAVEILEKIDEGFYAINPTWRLVYVNHAAEKYWGRPRQELLGNNMLELFPKFQGSPAHRAHEDALRTGTPLVIETTSTATGAPVRLKLFPDPPGLRVFFSDISHRLRLEASLRERDEVLTLAELSAGIGVWDSDLSTQMFRATPQFFRLHGLEPTTEPVSLELTRSLRHPQDRDRVVLGFADAIASGADTFESEYRIIRPDGEIRWIFGRGRVIRDPSGLPVRYSGVDIDITERKQQEDQLRMMTGELQHRTNNLLAVIQAMARQTARTTDTIEDFEERFEARIRGLADSNNLLVRQNWRGSLFADLVRTQLRPFVESAERLILDGPAVLLRPKAVQTIGLALHELATNASKYGALSTPKGRVTVAWRMLTIEGEKHLRLEWRESDGPTVKPPARTGFGRLVVERMVMENLNATVRMDFLAEGLKWTVDIPSEHIASG